MAYNYNVMNYYQSGGLMKRKLKTIFISLEQIDLSFGKGQQSSINFNNGWHNSNSGIYILNNVFYLADYALVYGGMGGADAPIFSGNTYVQNEKAPFAHWEGNLISNIGKGNMAKAFIKDVLGDTKCIYIEVN
jgi:hypothetical protein